MSAEHVQIRGDAIRLGQLLKLLGMVEHGAEAKTVIEAGEVEVNGEVEERRGRTLVSGDRITCAGRIAIID